MLPGHFITALNALNAIVPGLEAIPARLLPGTDTIKRINNNVNDNAYALQHVGKDAGTQALLLLDGIKTKHPSLLGYDEDGTLNEEKWKKFLMMLFEELFKVFDKMVEIAKENPDLVLAAIIGIAAPHLCTGVVVPLLEQLGFTSAGILAESSAAAFQALLGNISPRSLFAILQSAAMNGYGLEVISMFLQSKELMYLMGRVLYDMLFKFWGGKTESTTQGALYELEGDWRWDV